ncbi:MAG: hypothetical protein Q8R36_01815 [bacterium]|nr:hypothetical protein [bacterium]
MKRSTIFIFIGILIFSAFVFFTYGIPAVGQAGIKKYAEEVLEKCKDAPHRPSCFDREIPKLMDYISMVDAFGVAKIITEEDREYTHCHVLGHYLSGRETAKDPSKWKDVVAQCPTTICNNGCLHGPLLTRFNNEVLTEAQLEEVKSDLKDVCEPRGKWNPLEVEISMCYHGMGHLNMFITGADIEKSIKLCEYEGTKEDGRNYVQTCTQGVFMQIYQPLEPEDFALTGHLTQTQDTVSSFCNQFSGEAWSACRRESWALFRKELENPKEANKFCSYSEDPVERRTCFGTVMSNMTVVLLLEQKNLVKFKTYCDTLDLDQVKYCYGDAAVRLVQIDPRNSDLAARVCKIAPNDGEQCYGDMIQFGYTSFRENSSELKSYCKLLPAYWNQKCFAKDFSI